MSRDDVLKFVNSREWERKFSLQGEEYVIFPNYFKQPRTMLELDVFTNTNELHWWFWEKCFINELGFSETVNKKLKKHSVTFNVFVRTSVAKVDTSIIESRFPNYGPYLKQIGKEYETNNIDTLMQLNSSKQIENAVMAIEILKIKLYKELSQFPQLSGIFENLGNSGDSGSSGNSGGSGNSGNSDTSSELTVSGVIERPKITRGMSALDVRNITEVIDDLAKSRDSDEYVAKQTFLEKISPHLSRKHKKRK